MIEQLDEFLVFQGISTAGTLEQKAMGSFWMLDQNHDHKIGRDEIALLMRASGEASGESHSDEEISHLSDFVLKFVDEDKVCIFLFTTCGILPLFVFTFYCVFSNRMELLNFLSLSVLLEVMRRLPTFSEYK